MSIARRQIKEAMNEIIKKELQKGSLPSVESITNKLNQHFSDKVLGQPTMRLRPAKYRQPSSSQDWNDTIEEIYTDLVVLYEESLDQVERIIQDFDYAETEKRKINRKVKELESKIQELLLLNNNLEGYLYSVSDNFATQAKVDMNKTNCWIDYSLGEVTPMFNRIGTIKADLSNKSPQVSIVSQKDIVRAQIIGDAKSMLDDNLNTFWLTRVTSKTEQDVSYLIKINNLSLEEVNRITISPKVTDDVSVDLKISADGYNWIGAGKKRIQEKTVWDFDSIDLKHVEFTITRSAYDETEPLESGDMGFVYYIGVENISILKVGFENSGTIISKPLIALDRQGVEVPANKISLEVQDETPQRSSIDYYVALQPQSEIDQGIEPQWQPISPSNKGGSRLPKTIDMKMVNSVAPISNIDSSSAGHYTNVNGLDFFYLLNKNTLFDRNIVISPQQGTPNLYKGVNQWYVENYQHELKEIRAPRISDWGNLPDNIALDSIDRNYFSVTNSINLSYPEFTFSRYVTNLKIENDIKPLKATIIVPTSAESNELYASVYVNGYQVFSNKVFSSEEIDSFSINSVSTFTIPLIFGWNSVQILFYQGRKGTTDPEQSRLINLQTNLLDYCSRARAVINPMEIVSEFDLLHNVKEKEDNKFALTNHNDLIIGRYLKNQGAKYQFNYKYYLDESINRLLFRADLNKEDGEVSPPKLKSYKIKLAP